MADITVKAAYGSVVEDDEDGLLYIGFAEGEDEDEDFEELTTQNMLEGN